MNTNKAIEILNIKSESFTKTELKRAYRKASHAAHTDLNDVSTDAQQLVNEAYTYLSSQLHNPTATIETWAYRRALKEEQIRNNTDFTTTIAEKIDIVAYKSYIESFTNCEMNMTMDISATDFSGRIKISFIDNARTMFFIMNLDLNLLHNSNMISFDDEIGINNMGTTVTILVNHEKHKMTKSNYNFNKPKNFFNTPSQLFPNAKMKKIFDDTLPPKKMKKADYLLSLELELDAKLKDRDGGIDIFIPMGNDIQIYMFRITAFGRGTLNFAQIYTKNVSGYENLRGYLLETESKDNLDKLISTIKSLKGKSTSEIIEGINSLTFEYGEE